MQDKINLQKLKKYFNLTESAFEMVKINIIDGKEKEAKEIINMVSNYLSDARFFEEKGEYVNSFAALNYAHGWLDCGVRLEIFDVDDDRLFTIR